MKFSFLSEAFYNEHIDHTEIEQKHDRPYVQVIIKVSSVFIAVPMRSNINHKHAFFTNKEERCGVDFSKAVVITDEISQLDWNRTPYLRPDEFKALQGKEYELEKGMLKYIRTYQKASLRRDVKRNDLLCRFSTLQYFEAELKGILSGE